MRSCQGNLAEAARILGIHRTTVWRWIQRAKATSQGRMGSVTSRNLKRGSTRPQTIHYALTLSEQSAIIKLRKKRPVTAEKIQRKLKISAHPSTLHRLMRRKGVLHEDKNHRRPRYQKTTHMHLRNTTTIGKLQMDVKYITPELSGYMNTAMKDLTLVLILRHHTKLLQISC